MKIGWILDYSPYTGGAELTAHQFAANRPPGVDLRPVAPEDVTEDVDAYIVHNCTTYDYKLIDKLQKKPTFKYVHDAWHIGDDQLREWLLFNSRALFFCSNVHIDKIFEHQFAKDKAIVVPPAVDYSRFEDCSNNKGEPGSVCWIGRYFDTKGIKLVERWADEHNRKVDFYGFGPSPPEPSELVEDRGRLSNHQVASVLTQYESFIFMPLEAEPFARCVAEAYMAKRNLILGKQSIGATEYIDKPDSLKKASTSFWLHVQNCL